MAPYLSEANAKTRSAHYCPMSGPCHPRSLLRGEHLSNIILQVKRRALMRSLVGRDTQCL